MKFVELKSYTFTANKETPSVPLPLGVDFSGIVTVETTRTYADEMLLALTGNFNPQGFDSDTMRRCFRIADQIDAAVGSGAPGVLLEDAQYDLLRQRVQLRGKMLAVASRGYIQYEDDVLNATEPAPLVAPEVLQQAAESTTPPA